MYYEKLDLSQDYGLVLEGGGAKGAYQIGVWKALLQHGIRIKAVAGVSVGALNGALISMGDYEKAEQLWSNITYSNIMNVDDEEMDKLINRKFKQIKIQEVRNMGRGLLSERGIDVTPLKQLLEEYVDEQKIRNSEIEFFMGTFSVSNMKPVELSAKEAPEGYLKDYLMASANFPLFKNEKLMGNTYLDGGIANNVPIDMLIKRGYKNIIVIRIFGPGIERKVKIPEDVRLITIAPRNPLCNVLEFDKKKAVRNITLGYYDGLRVLEPLAGNDYYIKSDRSEKEYLDSLTSLGKEQMKALLMMYKLETNGSVLRNYMEVVYPRLASLFKLDKNWEYGELYYSILEYCAKKVRLTKYKIYTETEFCQTLYKKMLESNLDKGSLDDSLDDILELGFLILYNHAAINE